MGSGSTRSTSRTCRRRRTTRTRCSGGATADAGPRRRARAAERRGAAPLRRDPRLRQAIRGVRRRRDRPARGDTGEDEGHDHLRLRSALPPLDRSAPQGRPPTGLFLQLIHDGDEDVEIPEAGYTFGHLKNAQAVGDLLTLRDHGLPAVQVRLEGDPAAAVQALQEEILDAARLRRPRQDGRQHGAPDPPRLGAHVRRLRLLRGRGPRGRGARSHRRASLEEPGLEARGAALGLDHGAGRRSDAGHGRPARGAPRGGRHDHRRRQLALDGRQAPPGSAHPEGSTTWT